MRSQLSKNFALTFSTPSRGDFTSYYRPSSYPLFHKTFMDCQQHDLNFPENSMKNFLVHKLVLKLLYDKPYQSSDGWKTLIRGPLLPGYTMNIGPYTKNSGWRCEMCVEGFISYENEGKSCEKEWEEEILSWIIKMCLTFSGFAKKLIVVTFWLWQTQLRWIPIPTLFLLLYFTRDILGYLFALRLIDEDRNLSLCGPTKVQRLARGSFFWFIRVMDLHLTWRSKCNFSSFGRVGFICSLNTQKPIALCAQIYCNHILSPPHSLFPRPAYFRQLPTQDPFQ